MSSTKDLTFRAGQPGDASDLAILWDAASRGHAAWIWGTLAGPGQSWLEVGRNRVLNGTDAPHYHAKWHVAEAEGRIIGALFGFSIPDPYVQIDLETIHASFHPMIEMEMVAKGCWLVQAVALFPEARGKGYGEALMNRACQAARDAGHRRIVLQVESPNTGAISLYHKCGFDEWERRPFVPFPGSDDEGDWILMAKDL
ncbi:WecD Histone acetyltransferase HPA2 and related acetyltransferases [Paracoccaceae bacterium]|jgi:GNAT superfamily N-acetyltransferase